MRRCLDVHGASSSSPLAKLATTGPVWIVALGLEGSGHHGVCAAVYKATGGSGPCTLSRNDSATLQVPWRALTSHNTGCDGRFSMDAYMADAVKAHTYASLEEHADLAEILYRRLRSYARLPPATRLLMQCHPLWAGSYPDAIHARNNVGGRRRVGNESAEGKEHAVGGLVPTLEGVATAHFDARLLASSAERAGVDVRFVHLNRSVVASVASISRKKERPAAPTSRMLRAVNAELEQQLACLDPAFVVRLDADDDRPDANGIAAFLRLPSPLAQKFASALVDSRVFLRPHRPIDPGLAAYVRQTW